MFLGMQDFYFAQISPQFCPNFLLMLFKFRLNLTKFAQKGFAKGCGCIPSSYGTEAIWIDATQPLITS